MQILLLCIPVAAALLFLPRLTVQFDLHHFGGTQGRVLLRLWRWRRMLRLAVVRTDTGHQVVLAGQGGPARPLSPAEMAGTPGERLMQVFSRADRMRRFLFRHARLQRLDALFCLRLEDAARCAVLSGAMQGATAFLPGRWQRQVHLRVVPDFFREHSTFRARCILDVRLGTLFITACMLLAAYIREACTKKEV